MGKPRAPKPHNRDGVWYLRKRVPKTYSHLEKRTEIWLTTGILVAHDPKGLRAKEAVAELNSGLEASWQMQAAGRTDDAKTRFEAAQQRARSLQLPYLTNAELAAGPLDEIMKRIDLLVTRNNMEDPFEVASVMGGEERPEIRLSTLMAEYEGIHKAALAKKKKSDNQMRKWRNPRRRAIRYFLDLVGDKSLTQLTRTDAIRYQDWWEEHVLKNDLSLATANKSIGFLAKMLKDIDRKFQLGLEPIFADLRFAGARDGKRPAFTVEHVRDKILASGALDDLNAEARAILWVCAELGARPSEIANIGGQNIFVDAEIPFIRVIGDDRELKTHDSERDLPLVGFALLAMRQFPNGFPNYRDHEDTLSNTVNKYLKSRNLLPTEKHSLYSLRHTFEDRLTAVDPPDKIIASLMGHTFQRERYGEGPSLEQKRRWLMKIAFKTAE
ncbi:MAG: tyrosine-type recombinase/integrase [Roseibium sp.]